MAAKKKKAEVSKVQDAVHVKYVAAAGMWCTTTIAKGQQSQKWTLEKP